MTDNNTSTANITLPTIEIGKVSTPKNFIRISRDLNIAMGALADIDGGSPGWCILAGHSTECLIKAFLSHSIQNFNPMEFSHKLCDLWKEANKENKKIFEMPFPSWLKLLNEGHTWPHSFRYNESPKCIQEKNCKRCKVYSECKERKGSVGYYHSTQYPDPKSTNAIIEALIEEVENVVG